MPEEVFETSQPTQSTEPVVKPKPNFAGVLVRSAALVLDGLILTLPYLLVVFLFTFLSNQKFSTWAVEESGLPLDLAILLIFWCYNIFFITKDGATPGKRFFKVRVVQIDQSSVSLGKAILRETVGKILSSLVFSLGYFWVAFDRKKQAWHDKIAGTYVVCTETLSKRRKTLAYVIALLLPGGAALGMAAAMVLVAINPVKQIDQARDAMRKSDIVTLEQGIELYYTESSAYPTSLSELTEWIDRIPTDPKTGEEYIYQVINGGKDYILKTTLSTGEVYEVRGREKTPAPPRR